MPSTIWIGSIRFGKTDVPVKLHTAVRENLISFHLLHKTDRVKLQQRMVCALDKAPVPREEQVKGFQLDGRKYILIDDAELESAAPESSRTIDVHEFVNPAEIDPVYVERTYFLEPDTAPQSYSALAKALKETGAAGLCTWVMRKRAYFGALGSDGKTLRINTLRYQDEIIPPGTLSLEDFPLTDKELQIGSELIGRLSVPFAPQHYQNEHQKKLQALIDKKARGKKIALFAPKHLKTTKPDRLLETLQQSLKQAA